MQGPKFEMVKMSARQYLSNELNIEPSEHFVSSFLSLVDTKDSFAVLEQPYVQMKADIMDLMKKFSIRRLNKFLSDNDMVLLMMNFIQKPEVREQIMDTIKVKTNEAELKQTYNNLIDELMCFCQKKLELGASELKMQRI